MSEYRIAFEEIPNFDSEDDKYNGVLIHIRPPVQLNPEAVERYLTTSAFEPVNRGPNNDIKDVCLLGSTAVQTTIYASIDKRAETLAQQAAEFTTELLRLMGAQATIDNPPSPET